MTDDERSALYAAMYDLDALPEPKKHDDSTNMIGGLRKSRRMIMGAVGFDVPTVEYVESLEQRLIQQERIIQDQARILRRFDSMLTSLKGIMRKQTSTVNEMATDLDNKLDRRDLL